VFRKTKRIHFVGIGGIGMSGIAEVLLNLDYQVSGSDLAETDVTARLASMGASVARGHDACNVDDADVVVISSAVGGENPEVAFAHEHGIPVIPRAEMLAELMRMKFGVAVAGSHGKTTTTSMISTVLGSAGFDPTMVIGGRLDSIGSSARLGKGEYLVAEADESDGSFMLLSPTIAVITNIDLEHIDHYGDMDHLRDTFSAFANKVPFYGLVVLCTDCENVRILVPRMRKRYATYGIAQSADFQAERIEHRERTTSFDVVYRQKQRLGRIELSLPGHHSVSNCLAAVAVSLELDIPFETVREALSGFTGIHRRFEKKGEAGGVLVIDDYGHHPTEIRATLEAARAGWDKRRVVAFQPHRFTRSRDLRDEFARAFDLADVLILTEIYAAGERPIPGIDGRMLLEVIQGGGHPDVRFVPSREDIPAALLEAVEPGDIVITLGAGDIHKVGDALLDLLRRRDGEGSE